MATIERDVVIIGAGLGMATVSRASPPLRYEDQCSTVAHVVGSATGRDRPDVPQRRGNRESWSATREP